MQTQEDPRWDDLALLLALGRSGSLKRAAEVLGVNISTVARRLDAAEARLGVHLFDRTPDGTLPTATAERLLPYLEGMEQAAADFSRALGGIETEAEGRVRLAAPPGVVDHFLVARLPALLERHPRLHIELLSSVDYVDLHRREADLALRTRRPTAGDFVAARLATMPFAVAASPSYAAELGRLRSPARARWVCWGPSLSHLAESSWLTSQVDDAQIVFRCDSMTALIEATRASVGAMLVPAAYTQLHGLAEVALTAKLRASVSEIPANQLWLVGHRALRDVPRIAAVWTWLREQFAH
ncbi:LysR family transcriptional regulator [Pseudenhygromyxa sp. WMMC2535]|uniref:LysR family transcriptional regulator n=1 Tax=Pseudenhygromyxa sp. WMMC2535 TaxID=2712867 RepID=UPI0015546539|nr:LysR family transcriptional regulator [Pseudenhygromyxa sp. WMMC2535]NVB39424.1 LysR family transcriptional regulator [Pseudenhygromyxa sp. WMMC2535]